MFELQKVRVTKIRIIEVFCLEIFKGPEKFSNQQKFELDGYDCLYTYEYCKVEFT